MNNQCSYNLLYKPWIKCVLQNGHTEDFGLLDFNQRINEITDVIIPKIAGSNFPFYELAFYRFINVLYSRALNCSPWDDRDATAGVSNDEINAVEQYLNVYKDNFDIMSQNRPFMQATDADLISASVNEIPNQTSFVTSFVHLPSENAVNSKTLLGYNLDVDVPSNKKANTNMLMESIANKLALSPKEAVYHLLYLNSFVKCAGVAGCSSISSTPELYVIFKGKTVGQTLQMNLIPNTSEMAAPIWERDGVMSYYQIAESVDFIGYTFYPNRFCRLKWDDGVVTKLLYAPHNFKTLNDTSKNICRCTCEQYYQSCDRDALIKITNDKISVLKYSRTENWLTMLMSAVINSDEIPESSVAGREIFGDGGGIVLPKKIKIVLYGRSADGKSGVYQYTEKLEENIESEIFKNSEKRAYIEKYIRLIQTQFVISKKVVDKYYKLQKKVNSHIENKVPFINQCISLYAQKKINDVYRVLEDGTDINNTMEKIMKDIVQYTKNNILEMLSEDVLSATQAYNSIVFGGKK